MVLGLTSLRKTSLPFLTNRSLLFMCRLKAARSFLSAFALALEREQVGGTAMPVVAGRGDRLAVEQHGGGEAQRLFAGEVGDLEGLEANALLVNGHGTSGKDGVGDRHRLGTAKTADHMGWDQGRHQRPGR